MKPALMPLKQIEDASLCMCRKKSAWPLLRVADGCTFPLLVNLFERKIISQSIRAEG